jgi:pimeloyl-ACP methyl ester carboxylesterase
MTDSSVTISDQSPHALTNNVSFLELEGAQKRRCFLFQPASARRGAPLVVSVHGIARNAGAHVYRLMDEADRLGVCVLAPLFEKPLYGQYQQLFDARTGVRSDLALIDMVAEVSRLTGADGMRLLLLGYSGGAQFAHRFAMAYPERVTSAVLAAAGWYTFPDPAAAYPLGLDTAGVPSPLSFDPDAFLRTPMHVLVGDLDIARDASLRRSDLIDSAQGRTRVARAQAWVAAMNAAAVSRRLPLPADFRLLRAVGHSFSDAVDRSDLARLAFEHFACDAAPGPHK